MDETTAPPDDLEYRNAPGTRVTYRARQRRADRTVWLGLALHLPSFLISFTLVLAVALALDALLGVPAWLPSGLWAASGALAFHRPTERIVARHLLHLHRPLPAELAALAPVWREVTARAGVDGSRYELWVEESDGLNALAAAGHIVAVTRRALRDLPTSQLGAVLAHELGHHTSGHSWSGTLVWWYAIPGRCAWRVLSRLKPRLRRAAHGASVTALTVVVALTCYVAFTTLRATYGLPLLLLTVPWLAAAVGRQAELRADAHAARLGFGHSLALTLHERLAEQSAARGPGVPSRPGARLLSRHPDLRTRLERLQKHL
ncbi:M48 family metalloprotease [Streptomyces sp. NPDC047014]|uniref:M48 family metalloprotease n=1 Tax=Streptomyces sp. NPDC047014 TaxID=3155736 RepID=UPI0033F78751